jgi:hypothetical protein
MNDIIHADSTPTVGPREEATAEERTGGIGVDARGGLNYPTNH